MGIIRKKQFLAKSKDALPCQNGVKGYFAVQKFCFACIGINPTSVEKTYFNKFLMWFPMLSLLALNFLMFFFALENISDLDIVTDCLSPFWQSILAILKLIFFIWKKEKYVALIRKLWLRNLKAKGSEQSVVAKENRKDFLFCTFYHMAVVGTGIACLLAVFIVAAFRFLKENEFWKYLEAPLKASYFFLHMKTFNGYFIAYIWNCIAVYFIAYGSLSTDCLFSWLVCNLAAQYRILKYRLQKASFENNGKCSVETLKACIRCHCHCLELTNEFNEVFRSVVFIKFAISCIQICCLAFQFTRGGELAQQLYQGLFLLAVSLQMILYCYGGQRVQNESKSIAAVIYDSFHWESLTLTSKKMLILPILRSQKACNVSGIFFTADLSLFLWVYRTAASFITLLWTLDEKKNDNNVDVA